MSDFLNSIKHNFMDKNGKISASRLLWFFRKNIDLAIKLKELTPKCKGEDNYRERLFWLENGLKDYVKCANPGCTNPMIGLTRWTVLKNDTIWNESNHRLTCCNDCKHKLHSLRAADVNSSRKKTMLFKYGVEHSSQLNSNSFKSDNPMKKNEYINKAKNTCLEKYGVDNPSKDSSIMDKIINHGYSAKNYMMPSGNIVRIRGYEWKALDELLVNYEEFDIEVSTKKIPKIKYIWDDGSEHYYFPDIFIEKENLLIEVKSDYFMIKDFRNNLIKAQAAKKLGYQFRFMVYSGK